MSTGCGVSGRLCRRNEHRMNALAADRGPWDRFVVMKRGIQSLLACVIAITLAFPGSAFAGTRRTAALSLCSGPVVRPSRFVFTGCGGGGGSGLYGSELEWDSWHKYRATGRGRFGFANSAATSHGRVTLHHREWCASAKRFIFSRARLRLDHAIGGRRRYHVRLTCSPRGSY
jgi:hypothetical protein